MLLILPSTAFVLFFLILRKQGIEWRQASLTAAVFWGTCVVVITEGLSVPHFLTRGSVAISWLVICFAAFGCLKIMRRCLPHSKELGESTPPKNSAETLDTAMRALLVGAAIVFLLVAITATLAPPSTWDAMEYHLPRTVMWMSNRSVQFYPTPDYAQLIFGPWAEYTAMHASTLWGGDRFVNFIELFSYLGSVVGVSLIAKMLGAGLRGQVLAAVVCATIPQGILEASGPMNTYVVSFWIMTAAVFIMSFNDHSSWLNSICIGLAAGLALLTKGSAYVYLPFLVLACWWMGSTASRTRFLKRCPVFLLLILAVNGGFFFRCYGLTGSPLGLPFLTAGPGCTGWWTTLV